MGHHLLLLPLAWLAVTTVRDDLRHRRIYNRRLIAALGMGLAAYLLLALLEPGAAESWLRSAPAPGGGSWIAGAALNLAVGLAVGVTLWSLGVWAAGDAKLFAVYALCIPPPIYTRSYLPGFPAAALLVNVFALVFLLLAADLLRTAIPAGLRATADPVRRGELLRAIPVGVGRWLPLLLAFTAMFAGIRALREASREMVAPVLQVGDFTMFLLLFAVFRPLARVVVTRWGAVLFAIAGTAALSFLGLRYGLAALPGFVVPSLYAVVLLVFARTYPRFGAVHSRACVGDLAAGAVLAPESLRLLQARERREVEALGEDAPAPDEDPPGTTPRPSRIGSLSADGLTEEQVRFIRTRYNDDEPILIARTLPFSPLLAAGAAVTWIAGGPLTVLVTIR